MKNELLKKTGWSESELEARVKEKQKEFAGLITDGGAVELLARENGLKPAVKKVEKPVSMLGNSREGASVNVNVKVTRVLSPKKFEKNGRSGKVCNVTVEDEAGTQATLVLWNQDVGLVEGGVIGKGKWLKVNNAFVKTKSPLEIHSRLLTEIRVDESKPAETGFVKVAALKEGANDVDFMARVLKQGELREFEKGDKKGKVLNLLVGDEGGQIRLALWDRNAELGSRMKVGDAVKVEGAYVKHGMNGLEANVGWQGVIAPALNEAVADKEKSLTSTTPRLALNELVDGFEAVVEGKVRQVYEARSISKCVSCGKNTDYCQCGATKSRGVDLVSIELDDGTQSMRGVLFNSEARELLGLNDAGVDIVSALELKRDYVRGKTLKAVVLPKTSDFSKQLEFTVQHVISLT